MAIKVRDIVARVSALLTDAPGDLWSPGEIVASIAEAVRIVASEVPTAYTSTTSMTVVDGPKQTAPSGAITVVDVLSSMNSGGVRQRAVTPFDRRTLSAYYPAWMNSPPGLTRQWSPDSNDPKTFWVYPPAVAGNKLEVAVPTAPGDVKYDDVLPMDSIWAPALVDFALARAYAKDAEYAGETGRAALHMTAFYKRLPSHGGDS